MSYKKRKIFFYLFFLIFIAVGSGLTLYSQGYRLNTKEVTLSKIGGIFIQSNPSEANIILDGKPIRNKSWFLQSGTLIDNIVPGTHELELTEEGYHPWHKTIFVEPSLVSEIDSALLVKNTPPEKVKSDVLDIAEFGTRYIEKTASGTLAVAGTFIPGDTFIAASTDGEFALTKDSESGVYMLTSLQSVAASSTPVDLTRLFYTLRTNALKLAGRPAIQAILLHPQSDTQVFVATQNGLYLMDSEADTIELLANAGVRYMKAEGGGMFWQDSQNNLMRYDLASNTSTPIALGLKGAVTDLASYAGPNRVNAAFLLDSKTLGLASSTATTSLTIATRAARFAVSPDKKKIAFVDEDNKINVQPIGTRKKASFYLPIAGDIESFAWYKDSAHLILKYRDGHVHFTETDGINPVNVHPIAEGVGAYFYSASADTLYMLIRNELTAFAFGD